MRTFKNKLFVIKNEIKTKYRKGVILGEFNSIHSSLLYPIPL